MDSQTPEEEHKHCHTHPSFTKYNLMCRHWGTHGLHLHPSSCRWQTSLAGDVDDDYCHTNYFPSPRHLQLLPFAMTTRPPNCRLLVGGYRVCIGLSVQLSACVQMIGSVNCLLSVAVMIVTIVCQLSTDVEVGVYNCWNPTDSVVACRCRNEYLSDNRQYPNDFSFVYMHRNVLSRIVKTWKTPLLSSLMSSLKRI